MNITMESVSDKKLTDTFNGINPLAAPALYSLHFGEKHKDSLTILGKNGKLIRLDMLSHLEDKRTGFYGDVMIDKSTGHAVILFKGMDVPLKDEGNGRTGFLRDTFTAAQALVTGAKNWQTPFAEKLYQDTINNPDVKSVEVVGFSLGTLHANYIAAKYGVKGTVLANIGIANRGLKSIFNDSAEDVSAAKLHLNNNLTDLRMALDPVSWLGIFRHYGTVIGIDKGNAPDLKGAEHLAKNYAENARDFMEKKPSPAPQPAPALA
jgi:hypothetical protein